MTTDDMLLTDPTPLDEDEPVWETDQDTGHLVIGGYDTGFPPYGLE